MTEHPAPSCPICGRPAERGRSADYGERLQFVCKKCGAFEITRTALAVLGSRAVADPSIRQLLSFQVRQLQEIQPWPLIDSHRLNSLLSDGSFPPPRQQSETLVLWLRKALPDMSATIEIDQGELSSIIGAQSEQGVRFIIDHLRDRGIVRVFDESNTVRIGLTVEGWTESELVAADTKPPPSPKDNEEILRLPVTATYVSQLTIENFRCFSEPQTLDLTNGRGSPARWTVLLGENGVGKTTVLTCITALFPLPSSKQLSASRLPMRGRFPNDILQTYFERSRRAGTSNPFRIEAQFSLGSLSRVSKRQLLSGIQSVGSGALDRKLAEANLAHDAIVISGIGGGQAAQYLQTKGFRGRPGILVAYGASRLGHGFLAPLAEPAENDPVANLLSSDRRLRNPEEWLLQADYLARLSPEHKLFQIRRDLIRRALLKILPGITRIEIRTDRGLKPAVSFQSEYGETSLDQLSLGYQTVISLVVDFAGHLVDYYPTSADPLGEPAVALIDEIDLHLHPKWQRQIMSDLGAIFPATQFIVTAHSPLIVQGSENVNLAVLKREGDHVTIHNDVEAVRGWRVDQLLTSDLFELESARPPYVEWVLQRRRELTARKNLSAVEREELDSLNRRVHELPTSERPEDIEAMDIIRQSAANLIGRGELK